MVCAQCNEDKADDAFYVDKSRPRGRVARCKPCYRLTARDVRTRTPNRKYSETKENAKRRGIRFDLTLEQFTEWLWKAPCYYCGDGSIPHGVDRLNNERFYDLSNTVACCGTCNAMKGTGTLRAFLTRVKTIHDNLGLSEGS